MNLLTVLVDFNFRVERLGITVRGMWRCSDGARAQVVIVHIRCLGESFA